MTGPVLTPGALTPELCARAVVEAARLLKIDPATCFEKVADGRGRVRLLSPMVNGFGRWDWETARSLDLMAGRLHALGVPMRSRRATVLRSGI